MRTRSVPTVVLIIAIVVVLVIDVLLFLFRGTRTTYASSSTSSETASTAETASTETTPRLITPTETELESYYEMAYTEADVYEDLIPLDEMCEIELDQVKVLLEEDGYKTPSSLERNYKAWREEEHPYTLEAYFETEDETMYATEAVNVRSSYSTNSEVIGSLELGEETIVTGIGQGDAEGWYRIEYTVEEEETPIVRVHDVDEDEEDEENVGYVIAEYLAP